MNVRTISRITALIAAGAALATASWAAEYRAITILHTNDTHGHLLPFDLPTPRNEYERTHMPAVQKNVGGIARRATLAHRIEAEAPGDVLLVDAGDVLDGTPFTIHYMGESDFSAMAAAGYNLRINGNHDFNATLKEFRRNARIISCPTIDANVIDRKTGKTVFPPYLILDFRGAKVALFGLTLPSPSYKAAKEGIDFTDPIETAKSLVPEMRKQASIVIAVTHIGIESDEKLAKEVPGIDVIVGGHSHTYLGQPEFVARGGSSDPFSVGGTVIVQDYQWGATLGRLDLRLHGENGRFELMSYSGRLIPITSDTPEDPATASVVRKYYAPLARMYDQAVGQAAETFYDDRITESTVLNLISDAIREAGRTQAAIYNTGGVRDNIIQGPIRMWDVATVLPFMNRLVRFDMTGAQLKEALLRLKPGVSGVRYRIEDDRLVDATIDGKPIDDSATYSVASIDYVLENGLKEIKERNYLPVSYRDALKNYIKARGTISPSADGRRVVLRSAAPPM